MVREVIPDGLGITVEMWAETPAAMRTIVCALAHTITQQAKKIVQLEVRIIDLEDRLGKNKERSPDILVKRR